MSDDAHLMMHPNPPRRQLARVIFERSGAVTVQIGNYDFSFVVYACRYTDIAQAARDVRQWVERRSRPVEGDDPKAALLQPSSEELRSGRYLVTEIDEDDPQLEVVARDLKATKWPNAAEFASRLVSEEA